MVSERGGLKKSGIVVSKCYNMLCGSCGKRFTSKLRPTIYLFVEIMLLELTGSAEDQAYNVFDAQSFFNSVQSKLTKILTKTQITSMNVHSVGREFKSF